MYRISHGSINTSTRRESIPDLPKRKITNSNMNGTINATSRRNFILDTTEHKKNVPSQPASDTQQPQQQPPQVVYVKTVQKVPQQQKTKMEEIKDQYIKISASLSHINMGSNNIKKELSASKKEIVDRVESLSTNTNNIKQQLESYKKITNERIEKIANLFLSINK